MRVCERKRRKMPATEGDFETQWTSVPVCPHCGQQDADWWDCKHALQDDGDTDTFECSSCGKSYTATICIDVSFSTEKRQVTIKKVLKRKEKHIAWLESEEGRTSLGNKFVEAELARVKAEHAQLKVEVCVLQANGEWEVEDAGS